MPSSIVDGCGLHPRGTGSAFPNAPLKSVSKGRNDFGTTCFAFATTCKVARLPDGSDPKGPTETFTPGLSTGRSPFPPPGITTMVAGRLHRQDLHLLEHQLASLQLPKIPYGGFSPVRLQGRFVRRRLPVDSEFFASCGLHPSFVHLASLRLILVRSRGTRGAGTPPFKRPLPLYPRGPRSGPGYVVPVHHHLSGPMRPTRRHNSISPHSGLYALPSLCAQLRRLSDQRVDPCFRWHSFSTCRPPRPREVHRL